MSFIELDFISSYPQEIIAVDEVGRGPLVGPVVIGAVRILINHRSEFDFFLHQLKIFEINDSKKLSARKREEILKKLNIEMFDFKKSSTIKLAGVEIDFVTWQMTPEIIDQENILWASLRGMKEACLNLSKEKNSKTTVLIDGHKKFKWDNLKSPFHEIPIIKGDSKSLLIGLASIIAKEKRDLYMRELHEIYPDYGFKTHFGYPTKMHREAIKKFGPTPEHRKTFKGVKEFLPS